MTMSFLCLSALDGNCVQSGDRIFLIAQMKTPIYLRHGTADQFSSLLADDVSCGSGGGNDDTKVLGRSCTDAVPEEDNTGPSSLKRYVRRDHQDVSLGWEQPRK